MRSSRYSPVRRAAARANQSRRHSFLPPRMFCAPSLLIPKSVRTNWSVERAEAAPTVADGSVGTSFDERPELVLTHVFRMASRTLSRIVSCWHTVAKACGISASRWRSRAEESSSGGRGGNDHYSLLGTRDDAACAERGLSTEHGPSFRIGAQAPLCRRAELHVRCSCRRWVPNQQSEGSSHSVCRAPTRASVAVAGGSRRLCPHQFPLLE